MNEKPIDTIEFGKAIGDETRQKILGMCCCQALSVNEIVESLNLAQPTVSHHLAILKRAGLLKSERQGKRVLYMLNLEHLVQCCQQVAEDFTIDMPFKIIIMRNDQTGPDNSCCD